MILHYFLFESGTVKTVFVKYIVILKSCHWSYHSALQVSDMKDEVFQENLAFTSCVVIESSQGLSAHQLLESIQNDFQMLKSSQKYLKRAINLVEVNPSVENLEKM